MTADSASRPHGDVVAPPSPDAKADPLAGAVIAFDLDGTLVDSAPDLIGTLNLMLAEAGLNPVPLASARHLVGGGARRLLIHGFAEAGSELDPVRAEAMVDRFIALYAERMTLSSGPFPGVTEALDALSAAGATLAVCTNKLTGLSRDMLARLGLLDRFAAVVGADAVAARKPDPEHFLETVRRAGGDPRRALMVGDSVNDLLSARAAGAPVVLVSFGYTETPARELGAEAVIDGFDALIGHARRLLA